MSHLGPDDAQLRNSVQTRCILSSSESDRPRKHSCRRSNDTTMSLGLITRSLNNTHSLLESAILHLSVKRVLQSAPIGTCREARLKIHPISLQLPYRWQLPDLT